MIVLGIKCIGHDTGAAIIAETEDGLVVHAIAESRLNRFKHSSQFPLLSIRYCLKALGLKSLDEVDFVGMDRHVDQMLSLENMLSRPIHEYEGDENDRRNFALFHSLSCSRNRIFPVDHVDAHAASTYFLSPYDEATILVVDGGLGIYRAEGLELTCIDRMGYLDGILDGQNLGVKFVPGVGRFFDFVTEMLGYERNSFAAGKTMGLAAYGHTVPRQDYIPVDPDRHTSTVFDYSKTMEWVSKHGPVFDPNREPGGYESLLSPKWVNVARQGQETLNDDMRFLAREALRKAGSKNLCLAGGVALSCVANRAIRDSGLFDDVFIQPAASDEGIPLGVALATYYRSGGRQRMKLEHSYLGKPNNSIELPETLANSGLDYCKVEDKQVAELLAAGKIVARCQGASEYGPRALGNRSILADPRRADMRHIMNTQIKHREGYRPFAPSCLAEYSSTYFDMDFEAPFMIIASQVRLEWRDKLPAITHVDGSSRPQTVRQDQNARYYDLIKAFGDETGVYCLMNTSFNDNGEPIVETYDDAIRCMIKTGVDYLYIEDYLVTCPKSQSAIPKSSLALGDRVTQEYEQALTSFVDLERYEMISAKLNAPMDWPANYTDEDGDHLQVKAAG